MSETAEKRGRARGMQYAVLSEGEAPVHRLARGAPRSCIFYAPLPSPSAEQLIDSWLHGEEGAVTPAPGSGMDSYHLHASHSLPHLSSSTSPSPHPLPLTRHTGALSSALSSTDW